MKRDNSWEDFKREELMLEQENEEETIREEEPWWVLQDTTPFGGSL